jgi:Polysaccharide pyruvyl transferase
LTDAHTATPETAKALQGEPQRSGDDGPPMRILFQRVGSRMDGVLPASATLDQLRADMQLVSPNVGNLVHLEAPMKLLEYRRAAPAPVRPGGAISDLDRRYDGMVISYANMIRPRSEPDAATILKRESEAARIASTTCRVFVFGVGIQEQLPPSPEAVDPELFALLKVINDKAAIFGVRGEETERWLHSVGLTNARALGCPSMYVYPRNIMGIRSPSRGRILRVGTAGRLQRNNEPGRFEAISRIGHAFKTSYIFQTDFGAAFRRYDPSARIYDEATGEVDRAAVLEATRGLNADLPFRDYRLFRTTESWRSFAASKDAYFGDRFHGAVMFLQSRKPAIILQNDARVRELTAFFNLPTVTTREVLENDPTELLHERLSVSALRDMRKMYAIRYRQFRSVLAQSGLRLLNDIAPDELDAMV